jgi:type IV fimbrial biogenesis protein FimT
MRRKSVSGFTLIEMMIVIAIIAILTAIAAPNFSNYMIQRRLNGAARQVMSDLMWARMQAVSKNNNFKITFSGNSYTIENVATGETTPTKDIRTDYYDVSFSDISNNPIFSPRGTASALATITLTNAGGSKSVCVAITGRVKVVAGNSCS